MGHRTPAEFGAVSARVQLLAVKVQALIAKAQLLGDLRGVGRIGGSRRRL